jgi:hypothetical protein
MPRISGVIVGLLLLIVYIMIFIPFILPTINSLFMDWVNSNPSMFTHEWCTIHYVLNQSTNTFYNYTDCSAMDLRPTLIFVWQMIMYFILPITLALISFKLK